MNDLFLQLLSFLTLACSLAVKLIGYPHQIRMIVKSKRASNFSILQNVLTTTTYSLWVVHGIIRNDHVIILGQSLGILASGGLLLTILYYRKKYKIENIPET